MKSGGGLTSAVLQTAAVMRSYGQHNCRMLLGSNTDIEKWRHGSKQDDIVYPEDSKQL